MMGTLQSLYYNVIEVCELLSISRPTVDRLAKKGLLPGRVKIGAQVRYHKSTLHRWVNENAQREAMDT